MDPELQALLDRINDLTIDELADLRTRLEARAVELTEAGEFTDEVLAELDAIAEAVALVNAQELALEDDAADRQRRADEALRRIRGEGDGGEGEGGDGEGGEPPAEGGDGAAGGEGEGTGDGGAPPAEGAPAEGGAEGGEPAPATGTGDGAEPIAAGATPPARTPARISGVNARRPQSMRPRNTPPAETEWQLVAAANVPGITAGQRLTDAGMVASAFQSAYEASKGYRGGRLELPVVTMRQDFPAERMLGRDAIANEERIAAVTSPGAVTAAGGICAPLPTRYDLPTLGNTSRPVRDQMFANFGVDGAGRGGIRVLAPPEVEDVEGAISVWTEANDVAVGAGGGNPTTKQCLTITCEDEETTAVVDAIVNCFRFGNFRARFFAEQIEAWQRLIAVWEARFGERRLLSQIAAGSTQVSAGQVLGTTRDVLTGLDRAVASLQSRHRDDGLRFRWGAPFWLQDMMRADLAREQPGSSDERLAAADAVIQAFFQSRDVNVTWFLDGEPGQEFTKQGDGPLQGWPSTVVTYLYPEGSWLHLDGGELNLGMVRDSTLNHVNQVELFSEVFETGLFHGVESWRLEMDVCPDGSTSRAVDIDPCATGS